MPSVDLAESETDLEAERALQIEWVNTVIPLLHKGMLEKGDSSFHFYLYRLHYFSIVEEVLTRQVFGLGA